MKARACINKCIFDGPVPSRNDTKYLQSAVKMIGALTDICAETYNTELYKEVVRISACDDAAAKPLGDAFVAKLMPLLDKADASKKDRRIFQSSKTSK